MTKIFITGTAGFIGFHVTKRLINEGIKVIGIDNLNNYYDVNLKKNRLNELDKLRKHTYEKSITSPLFNIKNFSNDFYNCLENIHSEKNG